MLRTTKTSLAVSLCAAALVAAPAAHAETGAHMSVDVSAAVKGQDVTFVYSDHGMQHLVFDNDEKFPLATSTGYTLDFGDASGRDGGNGAGGAACMPDETLAPFSTTTAAQPTTHHYAKPGTYTVTATGHYCGDGGEKQVVKTITVTVGEPSTNPSTTTGSSTTASAGTGSGSTRAGSTSAPGTSHSSTSTNGASTGPKVNTDMVASQGHDSGSALAVSGFAVAGIGAGAVALRRRSVRN